MKYLSIFLLLFAVLSVGHSVQSAPVGKAPDTRQGKAAAMVLDGNGSQPVALPDAAALDRLIQTLENDEERKKFIENLRTLNQSRKKEPPKPGTPEAIGSQLLGFLSQRIDLFSEEFVRGARAILDLPNVYQWAEKQLNDPALRARWYEIIWKLALALAAGLVAEWLLRYTLSRPRMRLESRNSDRFWVKAPSLSMRTLLDLVPVAGFLAASHAALNFVSPGAATLAAAIIMINANVAMRVLVALARMIFAPAAEGLRLVPMRNEDANYVFIWIRRFGQVSIYGYGAVAASVALGLPIGGGNTVYKVLGFLVALMAVVLVLQNRVWISHRLRGESENGNSRLRARLADIWHVLAILYVAALYAVWALAVEDGFEYLIQATLLTLAIIVAAKLALAGFDRLARKIFDLRPEIRDRYPGLEQRANRYLPLLEKAAGVAVWLVAVFATLEVWGIDSFSWITSPLGQRVAGSLVTIAVLAVLGILFWEMTSAMIERYLSRKPGDVSARAKTLLPLMRTTLLVVLVTMFAMVSLSELGLNIGPLLAGAGVIGLAIGFGAQTLVKDIITGLFILIEDHIAVGDVIKVGSHAGVIEALSLRTIKLRDVAGVVHVIPFSEVTTLENMTKDFSRYVFEVGVAYREDTDHVVSVLQALGDEMKADPAYADDIVGPFEVLGVDSFGDNAVIIKARITTRPIKQWGIGREFNRRMKKRFDELGIEIPFPHRTIYFGEDRSGNAPPARIVTGVATGGSVAATAAPVETPVTFDTPVPGSGGADLPSDGE